MAFVDDRCETWENGRTESLEWNKCKEKKVNVDSTLWSGKASDEGNQVKVSKPGTLLIAFNQFS